MKWKELGLDTKYALMSNCKTFDEEMCVDLMLQTGMTATELAKLGEENICWDKRCIIIDGKVFPLSNLAGWDLIVASHRQKQLPLSHETISNCLKDITERGEIDPQALTPVCC